MLDLYLIFFLVGACVFAAIVGYSVMLQKGRVRPRKEDYIDPLFAELNDSKARAAETKVAPDTDEPPVSDRNDTQGKTEQPVNKARTKAVSNLGAGDKQSSDALSSKEGSNLESTKSTKRAESAKEKIKTVRVEPDLLEADKDDIEFKDDLGAKKAGGTGIDASSAAYGAAADAEPSCKVTSTAEPKLNADIETSKVDKAARSKSQTKAERGTKASAKLSFAQKLAHKVARRTNLKSSKPGKVAQPSVSKPVASKPPATTNDASVVNRDAPINGSPKLDKQSSTMLTELVARVKNPDPIEQQELLSLFRNHDFKFHRKVHIYGLNQLTDLWRDIEFELPSARFVELGVSIQLADREGAMSQKELHDFQQMALEFSNSFNAPFEFSMDIDEALKQAQLLDQIGRRYDSMAVLNVVPRSKAGFRMADIESCARDLMMSTDKNGIFMKTIGQKHDVSVLYRLACTDGSGHFGLSSGAMAPIHDLVVYMNVPATQDPELVFQQMVKDANSLATWLEGKVVDRAGRAMTQRSYSVLMQQISDIAFSMQQDGLAPGDDISKKLF